MGPSEVIRTTPKDLAPPATSRDLWKLFVHLLMGVIISLSTGIDRWLKKTGGSAELEPVMFLWAESCIAAAGVSQITIYVVKKCGMLIFQGFC